VGINLPLQCKQFSSGMSISAISQFWEDYCRTNYRTGFKLEMWEKLSTMNLKGLSAISSL
jgi:hypothetical protein